MRADPNRPRASRARHHLSRALAAAHRRQYLKEMQFGWHGTARALDAALESNAQEDEIRAELQSVLQRNMYTDAEGDALPGAEAGAVCLRFCTPTRAPGPPLAARSHHAARRCRATGVAHRVRPHSDQQAPQRRVGRRAERHRAVGGHAGGGGGEGELT
eukprot:4280552-Prymnesium_polylepis.1